MPLNPKALSPSTATTGAPLSTAAAMAYPMPMPMTPQVPLSRRWRGTCMSMTLRAMSSALAPSLTRYVSGRAWMTSRTAFRAPMNCMGCGSALSRSAILATFCAERAPSSSRQAAGAAIWPGLVRSASASRTDSMSPTSGAAMGWLLSISLGSMSTWMNFASGFHDGPSPWLSSQLRRAPTSITTSAFFSAIDRAVAADCGWSSGSRPFAIDIGT